MGWLGDGSHRGQVRHAWTALGLPPRYPRKNTGQKINQQQTRYKNPEKANNTKHSKTKLAWFSRLIRHSARKRGGLVLQCFREHMGPEITGDKVIARCQAHTGQVNTPYDAERSPDAVPHNITPTPLLPPRQHKHWIYKQIISHTFFVSRSRWNTINIHTTQNIYTDWLIDWLSCVLRPLQHSIGYIGDSFYRSKEPTNSIKVLKEEAVKEKKTKNKKQRKHKLHICIHTQTSRQIQHTEINTASPLYTPLSLHLWQYTASKLGALLHEIFHYS